MRGCLLAGLSLAACFVTATNAHHSPGALYLLDQRVIIEGVVTKYVFVNPHTRVYLDVATAGGSVEQWMAEGGTPNALRRSGWNGEEFKPGDRIKVTGNPPRDGSKYLHWITITRPDGSELYGEDFDFGAVDRLRRQQRD